MDQQISSITNTERGWVAEQIESASRFVAAFSSSDADQSVTLAALDRAFAAWLATKETDVQLINSAINCVGVAFGQFLIDGLGLTWVIATDEHGSDLAAYGLPKSGDILVFPANLVAKRWERQESHFLESSYHQIAEQIQAWARPDEVKDLAKPWWKFW